VQREAFGLVLGAALGLGLVFKKSLGLVVLGEALGLVLGFVQYEQREALGLVQGEALALVL
jgi:hypothetical protein